MVVLDWINNQLAWLPNYGKVIAWLLLGVLAILVISLLFSLILSPFMWLYNRFTDKNTSNVMEKDDLVIGELTEKIHGSSIGEVMVTGSEQARSVHPARLYREAEATNGLLLPVGTKVLIIDFDERGIALVVKNKAFMKE